jgi:hypothetical protein
MRTIAFDQPLKILNSSDQGLSACFLFHNFLIDNIPALGNGNS